MITENNLNMALSWVTEADRIEFNCCIGQYNLFMNLNVEEFDLSDYRPTVRALFFLYLSENEDNF